MTDLCAFVVGIDRYDQPGWSFAESGPCQNALQVIDWLLNKAKASPGNVFAFLDSDDPSVIASMEKLTARGVNLTASALKRDIEGHWRKILHKGRPPHSRLFTFWSGHGYAENDKTRIFILRDYTAADRIDCVFNASNFLEHLRSPKYQCFDRQIFLADVCAKHTKLKFDANREPPDQVAGNPQIAYFATPIDEYAKGDPGRGVFTKSLLTVLEKFDGWPSEDVFSQVMRTAFQGKNQQPYLIAGLDVQGEIRQSFAGTAPGPALFDSIVRLLAPFDIADEIFQQDYLRTVSDLGMPALSKATRLGEMVRELVSLRDADSASQVPYGLLQFLLRLKRQPELRDAIAIWLDQNAAAQGNDLATLRELLEEEEKAKILLVELSNGRDGISSYQIYVRRFDLLPVPEVSRPPESVTDWDDLCVKLANDIEFLQKSFEFAEVHFLADPPLFDRQFHSIVLNNGTKLGMAYVVILRHRHRSRSPPIFVRRAWSAYADALRSVKPCDLLLIPIDADRVDASGPLPSQKGLCYATFLVSGPPSSGSGLSLEKQILQQLLGGGVPYLYWLHNLPEPEGLKSIAAEFGLWLKDQNNIDRVPYVVAQQRISGNLFASEGTLLWDDPMFNPFRRIRGENKP